MVNETVNDHDRCCERHRRWLLAVALLAGGAGIGLGSAIAALLAGTDLSPLVWVSLLGRLVATVGVVFAWSSLEARPMAVEALRARLDGVVDTGALREHPRRSDPTKRGRSVRRRRRTGRAFSPIRRKRWGGRTPQWQGPLDSPVRSLRRSIARLATTLAGRVRRLRGWFGARSTNRSRRRARRRPKPGPRSKPEPRSGRQSSFSERVGTLLARAPIVGV